ncbi:MAG TPA: transcription antitermination factor NusB [Candidatus Omnitrophota bacterium]|nr:transcription antitermination factor NusB [Candidatus Omnitrophota bacterium]HPT06708.1 transcription antitermination factor NusB [Candidatus Omnitrophota bacterium]
MRKRTQAREIAIQILYQIDITKDTVDEALANFWLANVDEPIEEEIKNFSRGLIQGTLDNQTLIDEKLNSYANNWSLGRMAVVDRNILRLGCFELLFRQDIPPKVSINEAVELAKKYSGVEAGKFVNGILDKIKMERPAAGDA